MPRGKPKTEAQRRANHRKKFGSLKSLPKTRRGKNRRWITMINSLTITYKLNKSEINSVLDKELTSFITEKYGLEWTGTGYDLINKERDITFIKKVGE